jgi:galactose oxidase
MAKEDQDRCYHSVALLLPDGRVFSAGGGDWSPNNDGNPNDPKHSHTDAQFFKPPYLHQGGNRPEVSGAPKVAEYGKDIEVSIKNFDTVKMVSWHRIGSTTHSTNMSQSRRTLTIAKNQNGKLTVKAPDFSIDCPPGHYMLFVLDSRGVPAVAPIIQLIPLTGKKNVEVKRAARMAAAEPQFHPSLHILEEHKAMQRKQDPVVVGLTTVCPYGLGPCWGGAYEALHHLTNIGTVQLSASQADSVAFVYLEQDTLPDIDQWRAELGKIVNGTYFMRGLEMILSGVVKAVNAKSLTLSGSLTRPDLPLAPLRASNKVQWDNVAKAPHPTTDTESGAFERLQKEVAARPDSTFKVTGVLLKQGAGQFILEVRDFTPVEPTT